MPKEEKGLFVGDVRQVMQWLQDPALLVPHLRVPKTQKRVLRLALGLLCMCCFFTCSV